jgi:hypothetical protein
MAAAALITFWAVILLAAGPAHANCYETGAGLGYRGNWYALSPADRTARCVEAERRKQEYQDRQRERDAAREERSKPAGAASSADADRRQQECLVDAAACATPGSASGSSESGGQPARSRRAR